MAKAWLVGYVLELKLGKMWIDGVSGHIDNGRYLVLSDTLGGAKFGSILFQ